jgi:hypothetical protein
VSSPRRLGLPDALRMRHDTHFVEQLGRPGGAPIGRLIPVEDLDANPNQPRRSMDDLSELIASIREKGVLEPSRFVRLHARKHGGKAGPESLVDYGDSVVDGDAGRGPLAVSAGRHSI